MAVGGATVNYRVNNAETKILVKTKNLRASNKLVTVAAIFMVMYLSPLKTKAWERVEPCFKGAPTPSFHTVV